MYRDLTGVSITPTTTNLDFEWITESLTVSVKDQGGVLVPGSGGIGIGQVGGVANGGATVLPITDNSVYPTLGGPWAAGYSFSPIFFGNLCRDFTGVEITQTTDALDFEWITKTVTLTMSDQAGDPFPAAWNPSISFANIGGPGPGGTLTLPITDNSVYPNIRPSCAFSTGYYVSLSLFGNLCRDIRNETTGSGVEITQTTDAIDFEWITETVTITLTDQTGSPLPAAWNAGVTVAGAGGISAAGGTATLPLTDNNVYPEIRQSCAFADGFKFSLTMFGGNLAYDVVGVEIETTTDALDFEWITVSGPLDVIDASGARLDGSTWEFPGGVSAVQNSGDPMMLPITDNSVYSTLRLNYVNGFNARVNPITTPGMGTFQFEILPNADLIPQFFSIDGQDFGLRFRLNDSPVADAGDNLTIFSDEQSGFTIDGVATDPDGDAMTYRWLDGGGAEIQASAAVGASGEAPLNLTALASLALGNHTFLLEVSDGQVTSTDTMFLSVSNSPPDAAVGGGITAELGANVVLTGSASDWDGDALSWSWSEGATLLASGVVTAPVEGVPVSIPDYTLAGGLAVGTYGFTLTVSDGVHPDVVRLLGVDVIDTTAPTLSPVADRSLLWPPNHSMVDVTITLNAGDLSGTTAFDVAIASNEDADKDGDGNTIPDFTTPVVDSTNGTVHVLLRAERSGKGGGRTYTITITATDSSGNSTTSAVEVHCPHDRRRK
ncbi:MAG: hypothetical protein ACI91B_003241 [Planctomycetota bacterium]